MKKIFELLSRPFRLHLSLFLAFFVFTYLLGFVICFDGTFKYWICLASQDFLNSYILTFIYSILHNKLKKIYLGFVWLVVGVFFIMDLFAVVKFKHPVDEDIANIIYGTNINESQEFLAQYLSVDILFIFLLFVAFSIFLFYTSEKKSLVGKKSAIFALSMLLGSLILNVSVPSRWKSAFFGRVYMFISLPKTPNLKEYLTHPKLEAISNGPQNIVVVFGESLAKKHCSLYNYEKNTNPRLSSLVKDSLLYVFSNVESTALNTVPAFKTMMSTYRMADKDSLVWYECTTLPEIINSTMYESVWISNQSARGLYDNVVAKYAELCDTAIFIGDKYSGTYKKDFDEEVLKPLSSYPKDSHRVYFVHLMGSHPEFKSRYPSTFNKFQSSDYLDYPTNQREVLAAYDNSVLYNDSVVYEIIDIFKDRECILLYLSDHALDIFDSDDNYCAHAYPSNPISVAAGKKIPFLVYMSDSYQKSYPKVVQSVQNNLNKPYLTENILYTIMDIIGVKFQTNNDVKNYSLFASDFNKD